MLFLNIIFGKDTSLHSGFKVICDPAVREAFKALRLIAVDNELEWPVIVARVEASLLSARSEKSLRPDEKVFVVFAQSPFDGLDVAMNGEQ